MALLLENNNNNCEDILFSLDSHKSVPAPFLTKTYNLVDDPTTDHIVSWGENDTTFVVWRPSDFSRDLLPNYFKHNNFSSFVRQLNTYGFRKIVPDRWEFANELFKKGEKHLLCEIHRRKTTMPQQVSMNYHHDSSLGIDVPSFFPFTTGVSTSPPYDSDEQPNWCDSPPPTSVINGGAANYNYNTSVTALSEDNERLRRSNNMLMSELADMKKLYNDIIYFVQNHVKPVAPSNTYSPSSFIFCNAPTQAPSHVSMVQRPMNQILGYYSTTTNPKQSYQPQHQARVPNSPPNTSRSSVKGVVEGHSSNTCMTKLFGVSLQSKKRVHPEYGSNFSNSETNKARLVLEKDDLGLNLMPPNFSYK